MSRACKIIYKNFIDHHYRIKRYNEYELKVMWKKFIVHEVHKKRGVRLPFKNAYPIWKDMINAHYVHF